MEKAMDFVQFLREHLDFFFVHEIPHYTSPLIRSTTSTSLSFTELHQQMGLNPSASSSSTSGKNGSEKKFHPKEWVEVKEGEENTWIGSTTMILASPMTPRNPDQTEGSGSCSRDTDRLPSTMEKEKEKTVDWMGSSMSTAPIPPSTSSPSSSSFLNTEPSISIALPSITSSNKAEEEGLRIPPPLPPKRTVH